MTWRRSREQSPGHGKHSKFGYIRRPGGNRNLVETTTRPDPNVYAVEEYAVEKPYYLPIADEVELFETAYAQRIPVLLKGPTGAGKTRFVEYMAYMLGRPISKVSSRTGEEAEHRMPL